MASGEGPGSVGGPGWQEGVDFLGGVRSIVEWRVRGCARGRGGDLGLKDVAKVRLLTTKGRGRFSKFPVLLPLLSTSPSTAQTQIPASTSKIQRGKSYFISQQSNPTQNEPETKL